MQYIVYLDEFGHIGPFVSRRDPKYRTSPVFGFGGVVLPCDKVRIISHLFFDMKNKVFAPEIKRAQAKAVRDGNPFHIAQWEMKGSSFVNSKTLTKYRNVRNLLFRMLLAVESCGGFVFYTGIRKDQPDPRHNAKSLYTSVLKDAIRRLNRFCENTDSHFMLCLDSIDKDANESIRRKCVEAAGVSMHGHELCMRLIERPFQVESHLFHAVQLADWICAIVGKTLAYQCDAHEFSDYKDVHDYFSVRLRSAQRYSAFRG